MKVSKILTIIIVSMVIVLLGVSAFIVNGIYQNRKLFDAIEESNIEKAQTAIDRGAWVNLHRHLIPIPELVYTNPTPLIEACSNGNEQLVLLLLENGADVNKRDNCCGETPLLAALDGIKQNRFSLAMKLIEKGADYNACREGTNSPFQETLLVPYEDEESTIEEGFEFFVYLVEHDVDMSIYTSDGANALTYAARFRNYNAVEYLVKNNYYDVNSRDEAGNTALDVASKYEQEKMVELLISLGADK